ncbi:hypothetical protein BCR36DRAFT_334296 [Piromyces finnis]|uniref:Coth-domain-containing protein n=1 Tax=Piromyces finnis TaxID=1754191 RepID=A0A1Y1V0Q8_9FUNG|nr:hypothetical protein BCR36DRAFT_334296 [Piromyces finnis]|eukprot:ORX44687.1 hypothetical protein BCR36DRAFT_334296 [Piromyces finnis]
MKEIYFSSVITILIALCEAAQYTFNVVSINKPFYSMGVKYNGIVTELPLKLFPLYSGSITADNINEYKYVLIDKSTGEKIEETITRVYKSENKAINEVYNRTTKEVKIPELPEPFREMFKMGTKNFKPFPNNDIYNVYANCDPTSYDNLKATPFVAQSEVNESIVNCEFNIITRKSAYQGKGTLHVIGFGSRKYKKLSWAIKLDEKFHGRKAIKLRALASDPTLIREKVATELYNAVGVPVQEGTYARLIINNDIYGLYTFNDNLSSKWIAAYVHGNEKANVGMTYKIYNSGNNSHGLKYLGDDPNSYTFYKIDEFDETKYNSKDKNSLYSHIINFTKLFNDWEVNYSNDTSEIAIKKLEEFLNLESTLRLLVIDALIVALDNFWLTGANAALYFNPEKNNYQLLPYDFDLTLQGSRGVKRLAPNEEFINDCETWTNYDESDNIDHFFTKSLLKHPLIKKRYETILAKTTRITFNPDVISQYVKALAELIKEDVQWNFDLIDHLSTSTEGKVNHFSYSDFEGNLYSTEIDTSDTIVDGYEYGVIDFVTKRSSACAEFTKNIDVSKIENENDKKGFSDEDDSCKHSISIKFSFVLFLFSIYILYH